MNFQEELFSESQNKLMIPFLDLSTQQSRIFDEINHGIQKVLAHGKYILGPEVYELEEMLQNYTKSAHCITVANGTDALQIALMSLDIGRGDEVITPSFSYIATAEVIKILGAEPVYIDIDPLSFNLDPSKLEKAISPKTKAIIPVSLYGVPANFDKINSIANKYSIPVIEDAAQSFGAQYKNRKSCNLSLIGCTSFFPTKPLGCYGDGGAVFTSDEDLAKKIRQIAQHGQKKKYHHIRIGVNSRLDTIQAAILIAKLKILDIEIAERAKIANNYTEAFRLNKNIQAHEIGDDYFSAWAQYTIRAKNRDQIKENLLSLGIPTMVYYPLPLSSQPAVCKKSNVPESEMATKEVLSLPIYGTLKEEYQNKIIEIILKKN